MTDETVAITILNTEIDILQQLLDSLVDAPSETDGRYMSDTIYNILCGHVETLKILRTRGHRAIQMEHNCKRPQAVDICEGNDVCWTMSKDERTNNMCNSCGKVINLRNENNELSRINAVRLDNISRLQDRVDELTASKNKLESQLREADNDYNHVNDLLSKRSKENDKLSQKNVLISTAYDMLKDKYDRCQTTINALMDDNREMVKQIDHIRDVLKMDLSCNTRLDIIADIVKIPRPERG